MTTSATMSPARNESAGSLLRRAMAGEWTRLWTLRSTWVALLAATALMLFIGAAAGADHSGTQAAPIWRPAQIAIVPAQFTFLLVVLLAVTGEYSTGAIHSTLQWVPRRGVVLAARTIVPVVFVTVYAVIAALAAALVAWAFIGPSAEVIASDIAASLGRIALVVAFGSTLTTGVGLLLRSTAGTLTAMFLLLFGLVVALGNTGVPWLVTLSDHLPGRAIVVLVADEGALTASTIATVMIAWTAAAIVAGGWSLLRRDVA